MYRSRLVNDLSDITLDYVSSINDDSEIALYDILGSQAHVLMLYENKVITKNDVKKILSSLEDLKNEKFDILSSAEDIHDNLLKVDGIDDVKVNVSNHFMAEQINNQVNNSPNPKKQN